jgi:hypothetical protein
MEAVEHEVGVFAPDGLVVGGALHDVPEGEDRQAHITG